MADFRYAQLCPVARALEILGSRWTLLVVRELFVGPRRFADLKQGLPGVSTSVLAERLALLERRAIVARRELPPPASATVYELTAHGRALRPVLVELLCWGLRFLGDSRADDHFEPAWLALALEVTAASGPSPARRVELRLDDAHGPWVVRLEGGPRGTRVERYAPGAAEDAWPWEVRISGEARALLPAVGGLASAEALGRDDGLRVEGDRRALADLPALFELRDGVAAAGTGAGRGTPHVQPPEDRDREGAPR